MRLVECVPNFSEGRRPDVVASIRDAIAGVPGVAVLDVSSDPSHHRSVITFVAPIERAVDAAFAGVQRARDVIDLTAHHGEHPRMGATDVVPFVPLESSTMEDCIALAHQLGQRIGRELEIPVYLYERAATRPDRENLADIRRGEFEGLRDQIGVDPTRAPDFGPARVHPTAGAVAVGARPFLVAYNVYLGGAHNLAAAKEVAKAVRHSSGGLRFVKALGLEVEGQAQVSMNLVDTDKTPLYRAYDLVKMEAAARGVSTTWSEIVGLVPERVLFDTAARHVQLANFSPDMVLERRVNLAMRGGPSLSEFLAAVAAPVPAPGGGSAAAHAGAVAASLVQMVAGLTLGRKKYAAVEAEMRAIATRAADLVNHLTALGPKDAAAYGAVSAAYKLPMEPHEAAAERTRAISVALLGAAEVPLETARACADVAKLAAQVAVRGNANAVSDAGVAALLAEAGGRGAVYNVRINVASLPDRSAGTDLVEAATHVLSELHRFAREATAAVDRAIPGP